jgi:hypothetical protein
MTNQEIGRSLASSFVEMAQALDELPRVQADLADAKAQLDKANARIVFLENFNTELGDRVHDLEAKYADATKSATGHKTHVDFMLDEIRKAVGQLAVVTDIVDPKPVEPEVALPNPLSVGQSGQSGQMTGEGTSQTAVGGDSEHSATSPFDAPTSSPGNDPSTGTGEVTPATSGQSEAVPTSTPHTEAPTGHSVDGQSGDKPDPRPYWLKPSNMTWGDWKTSNGDVPYWVTEDMMHDHLA